MLPMEEYQMRTQLDEISQLHSEVAVMGEAIRIREAQLNQINEWLMAHGYGEPDRDTAARAIRALESRPGTWRGRELSMLRILLKRITPFLERKATAGACMHDIETTEDYRIIWSYVQEIQAYQQS